jgi:DNA-directed RNA polymerase specialized sigma24 family protein
MRARWEGLHAALVDSVTTLEMAQQFDHARRAAPELEPFATVTSLLAFLESRSSSHEDTNVLYRTMVHAVQARTAWAPLATSMLWCGLWPGLDAVSRRQRRYFVDEPEELSSLIGVVFTTQVAQLDLQHVRRVAATLTRSTEREVARARGRQRALWAYAEPPRVEPPDDRPLDCYPNGQVPVAVEQLPVLEDPPDTPDTPRTSHSVLGILQGLSTESQVAAIYRWLYRAVGDDAGLFLAVAVFGENPEDLAAQLGLSHAALRKRIQRIRTRLQSRGHKIDPKSACS